MSTIFPGHFSQLKRSKSFRSVIAITYTIMKYFKEVLDNLILRIVSKNVLSNYPHYFHEISAYSVL